MHALRRFNLYKEPGAFFPTRLCHPADSQRISVCAGVSGCSSLGQIKYQGNHLSLSDPCHPFLRAVPFAPAVVITDPVKWRSGNVKSYVYVLCMLGLTAYVFNQQAQCTLLEIWLCSLMDGVVTSRRPFHAQCCVRVSHRAVSLT
jgi:hypothetical protein